MAVMALRRAGQSRVSADCTARSLWPLRHPCVCTRARTYPHTPEGTHVNALRDTQVPLEGMCTGTPAHTGTPPHTFWDAQIPAHGHARTRHGHTCTHTGLHTHPGAHAGTPSGMYRYPCTAVDTWECRGKTPEHTHTPESTHVHTHTRAHTYTRGGARPAPPARPMGSPSLSRGRTHAHVGRARRSLWFRRARRAPPAGQGEWLQRGKGWLAPGWGQGSHRTGTIRIRMSLPN